VIITFLNALYSLPYLFMHLIYAQYSHKIVLTFSFEISYIMMNV